MYFNSRPSARGDLRHKRRRAGGQFQFTPLREGRRARSVLYYNHKDDFNSRPSARGDMTQATLYIGLNISIHAPPRGATHARHPHPRSLQISIHAPPRGATSRHDTLHRVRVHFNSRPSARGDAVRVHQRQRAEHFNSRPSARGDDSEFPPREEESISIHAPPRGATRRRHDNGN